MIKHGCINFSCLFLLASVVLGSTLLYGCNNKDDSVSSPPKRLYKSEINTNKQAVSALAVTDVDGDSDLDIIAAYGGLIRVHLNDGSGRYLCKQDIKIDEPYVTDIKVGDLDDDKDLDVVVATMGRNYILVNDGYGNFDKVNKIGDDKLNTKSLVLADIDSDGDIDVVTGNGEGAKVYLNDGLGIFDSFHDISRLNMWTKSVALSDVDADGDFDLAVGTWRHGVLVYLNKGDGTFSEGTHVGDQSDSVDSVVFGDMNGDGYADIVAGSSRTNHVYLNDKQGRFLEKFDIDAVEKLTKVITLADIDCDGYLDVLVGNENGPSQVYMNKGGIKLEKDAGLYVNKNTTVRSAAAADINGDGGIDFVLGDVPGGLEVLLNSRSGCKKLQTSDYGVYPRNDVTKPQREVSGNLKMDVDSLERTSEESEDEMLFEMARKSNMSLCYADDSHPRSCTKAFSGDDLKTYLKARERAVAAYCDSNPYYPMRIDTLANTVANPACYIEFNKFYAGIEDYLPHISITNTKKKYVNLMMCARNIHSELSNYRKFIFDTEKQAQKVGCKENSSVFENSKMIISRLDKIQIGLGYLDESLQQATEKFDKISSVSLRFDLLVNERDIIKQISDDFKKQNSDLSGKNIKAILLNYKNSVARWRRGAGDIFTQFNGVGNNQFIQFPRVISYPMSEEEHKEHKN